LLKKIFGPKMDEVTGDSKILQEEELRDRYSSPNVIRVIKSGRMRWSGHVKRTGQRRGEYRGRWGNLKERDHLEYLGVDGRKTLKWILKQ
jgi:hypothetical protein